MYADKITLKIDGELICLTEVTNERRKKKQFPKVLIVHAVSGPTKTPKWGRLGMINASFLMIWLCYVNAKDALLHQEKHL